MNFAEAIAMCPHMASPATLARADSAGKWSLAPHLEAMNNELVDIAFGFNDRLIVNLPFQVGKSVLCSHYFPAWMLLNWPATRIILAAHSDHYAATFGSKVREVINRFGRQHNIHLKQDTKAKGEWVIKDHGGGLVCKGVGAALVGRPADCLVGETLISTQEGLIRIDDLCKMPIKPLVLSFNEKTGRSEWRAIVATKTSETNDLVKIETRSGNTLLATGSHRLYAGESEYRLAKDCHPGQSLFKRMPDLLAEKRPMSKSLPSMLCEDSSEQHRSILRSLWRDFFSSLGGSVEKHSQRLSDHLLARVPVRSLFSQMQEVRQANRKEDQSLLRYLPSFTESATKEAQAEDLQMQEGIFAEVKSHPVLLSLMCQRRPFGENDRGNKFSFQNGDQLFQMVQENASADFGERWALLHSLRREREISCSPVEVEEHHLLHPVYSSHQRETAGQSPLQSGGSVQQLPHTHAQNALRDDAIQLVERLHVTSVPVYDIQVEGNSNFFANEILVHNCLIIDDPIKDAVQAMSATQLESQWDWFVTAAYSRLGPKAPIVIVTTRWAKGDLCGRLIDESKKTGEKWKVIKFRAIAGDNDILGRKKGEALWPERQPLQRLERIRQTRGRWFEACWQQEPPDEGGLHFQPRPNPDKGYAGWSLFTNLGDAFTVPCGTSRTIYYHSECTTIVVVDWAMGKKAESDFTCFIAFALTKDGNMLILDCVNERIPFANNSERLDKFCQKWRPNIVAGDDDMLSDGMMLDCRRRKHIPEVKRMPLSGKPKIVRAQAAIIRGQNGTIYLPITNEAWLDNFMDCLSWFTGIDDDHDDVPDALGIGGRLADELKGDGREQSLPEVLIGARDIFGNNGMW